MAKGHLIALPDEKLLEARNHKFFANYLNRWGKLGNIERIFVDTFNRLWADRNAARYLEGEMKLTADQSQTVLATIQEMYEEVKGRAPRRVQVNKT